MGSAVSSIVPLVEQSTVTTWDGTELPSKRLLVSQETFQSESASLLVFLHGLGERRLPFPRVILQGMSDYDDTATSVNLQNVLGKGSLPPANIPSIILFDGRGHGNSSGWEGKGPEQFHWKYLGLDMLQVAAAYRPCLSQPLEPNYIFGGCSMGAAAAVWAAVMYPRRVAGLVLFMVPTMWATRQARRGALEAKADALRASEPNRAEVMTGAARADFPPREDLERLAATGIPVLIVTARDDPIHPASSAETLGEIFGSSARVVTDCKARYESCRFVLAHLMPAQGTDTASVPNREANVAHRCKGHR
eukprot:s2755_g12.t1